MEAAGDVNVLLLDKTGTITFGNRQAVEFYPAPGVTAQQLAEAAELSSLADDTPEGRSIVALARAKYNLPEKHPKDLNATFIPFSAEQRVSGIVINERHILKGAGDAIAEVVKLKKGTVPAEVDRQVEEIARKGGTPLMVAEGGKVLGVVYLKDIVKPDIKLRLAELRKMGIKSVMITGDNPLNAVEALLKGFVTLRTHGNVRVEMLSFLFFGHRLLLLIEGIKKPPLWAVVG